MGMNRIWAIRGFPCSNRGLIGKRTASFKPDTQAALGKRKKRWLLGP